MELIQQTAELKQDLDELKVRYEANNPPETMNDTTFFLDMKAATEPIYSRLEEWETAALDVIKNRKINVHPHQIASTRENMELLILDRKSTRLNSSHVAISYAVFCLKKEIN